MKLLWSSIGKKVMLAVTGIALMVFLVAHMAGNLLALSGPEPYNEYTEKLTSNPLIYVAEFLLLGGFTVHFVVAIANQARNRFARPKRYKAKEWAGGPSRKSLASTLMIATGVALLLFVPFHLWTFKFGPNYSTTDGSMRDLHRLVVEVFESPTYTLFYVVMMTFVGLHLWHGFSSAFQSLGGDHPRYTPWLRGLGALFAVVIAGGFILVPLAVYLDFI